MTTKRPPHRPRRAARAVRAAAGLGLAAVLLLAGAPGPAEARTPKGLELLESIQSVFVDVADQVQQGVVSISPTEAYSHPAAPDFPGGQPGPDNPHGLPPHGLMPEPDDSPGNGAGVVLDPTGLVVTNAHVVGNAPEMVVRLADGRKYTAEVIGKDTDTDLAVLKLERASDDTAPLPVLPLADSEKVRPGQWTLAVGNPFGLERTVTVGIVSGVGREGVHLTQYENFIQTDASINPGNSGGPLFNIQGEVIGINTAIMSFAQGIGFAIPSNMVRDVVAQLEKNGHVERGWLGVGIQEINGDLAETFAVPEHSGVLINEVFPGHPAHRKGLKPGDIIVSLNGRDVASPSTLARLVAGLTPDSVARVTFLRDGERHTVDITLGRREGAVPASAPTPAEPAPVPHRALGLDLQTLTPELAEQLGVEGDGVVVTEVQPGSAAQLKGIQKGDVIREVNRKPVARAEEVTAALKGSEADSKVLLRIIRDGGARYVVVAPGG
jgi:serine protease Do